MTGVGWDGRTCPTHSEPVASARVSAVRRPEVSDVEEAVPEVVAEQGIGTLHRVRDGDGAVRIVEVHRADMPWGRPPCRVQLQNLASDQAR